MHDLQPLTALGQSVPHRDLIGETEIVERTDIALASVTARAGQEKSCARILRKLLGEKAPDVGKACVGAPMEAFWAGPEQWFVAAPFDSHEGLAAQLKADLGAIASVTEQTDGWTCFEVAGPAVVDIFERLCPAPARRMDAGDIQRTTIHHLGCFVNCREKAQRFRVLGPRSSAGSLHHALCTAARAIR